MCVVTLCDGARTWKRQLRARVAKGRTPSSLEPGELTPDVARRTEPSSKYVGFGARGSRDEAAEIEAIEVLTERQQISAFRAVWDAVLRRAWVESGRPASGGGCPRSRLACSSADELLSANMRLTCVQPGSACLSVKRRLTGYVRSVREPSTAHDKTD